jgi:putative ABC transport system permease protein
LRIAVGATPRDIRWQFLIEAVTLALIGGVVGTVLGAAAAVANRLESRWPILISPDAIILTSGFAALVGIFFGLYPAHRAARLNPIVALRYE